MSRGLTGGSLALAVLVASRAAPAQTTSPPARSFPIVVQSEDAEQATYLLGYEAQPPFAQCPGACSFYGYPARYTLSVRGSEYVEGSRTFELSGPSRVVVEPRTAGERSGGLALGLVGAALLGVGATMMLSPEADRGEGGLLFLGLATFTTGAVLTPIGFVKFGRRAPAVRVEPL